MFKRKKLNKEFLAAPAGRVTGTGKKPIFSWRKLLLILLALALLASSAFVYYRRDELFNNQCQGTREGKIYDEAQYAMGQLFQDDLKLLVEKVKKQKNFESDASCLYPMVVFYIRSGDGRKAEEYYMKMQKSYKDDVGFAKAYGLQGRKTIREMGPAIVNLITEENSSELPKIQTVF
ncbi:MAG: hypothetical protein U0520_01225 [Candidatus Saccharimonadales bacterium]